jgi:AraC family ethanolamine operon transcriptional activator
MREANYYQNKAGPDTAPPAVGEVAACDPSLYELLVRPWELINTPLERGEFGYRMRYLKTPAITVYQEQFDLGCRILGLSPQGIFVFSVPVRLGTCSTYWKAPLSQSGFPMMLPSELDVEFGRGHLHLIVLIDLALLNSHLPAELYDTLQHAATTHLLRANSTAVERFGNWLLALLEETNCRPYVLQYPAALRSIEEDLLGRLVDVALALSAPPRATSPSRRRRGFFRALEFLREADRASVTIPELSEVAGVSTRTLEHAFREAFDLSPLGFLRLRRFHAARCELLVADSHRTTVTEIAYKAGFYHLARFAVNYRRLFGEPPSETLKKQYTYTKDKLSPLVRR